MVCFKSGTKQTKRHWAPAHSHDVVECKKAYREKIMTWDYPSCCVVRNFVNSDVRLEMVLKNCVWHAVKAVATRPHCWFQQDGASCHVTAPYLEFMNSKFGVRFISRRMVYH